MTKKKLVKILPPCLIVAVIVGIYLFKNPPGATQPLEDSTAPEDAAFALTAIDTIMTKKYGLSLDSIFRTIT
ncbi:hypothetical protein N510_001750 [Firmicutes bacterium ASF500]|nr:hypothetical protein N510_001750 [Firmicutes bacterium ASF500]